MKVAIVTVQVPFTRGGAELLAEACKEAMLERKINADIITLPFLGYTPEILLDNIEMARLLDLSDKPGHKIDKVVALKFPAYYCQHQNKSLWLLHQHRTAYDLYDSQFSDLKCSIVGKKAAQKIKIFDNKWLPEHRKIFTISQNIADRLDYYNGIATDAVLYPPPKNYELFKCKSYENFIIYPSRFTDLKRQELIVRAMQWAPKQLKLILIGDHKNPYGESVCSLLEELNLKDKIIIKNNINEEEKLDLYSRCLAVYNGVYDEDYGYLTIEAFLASKPVITHSDSGGPLEFVVNKQNGFVTEPLPEAIAEALNQIYLSKDSACKLGKNGLHTVKQKKISWDHIIDNLLS